MHKKDLRHTLEGDPLWYKDAIIYELHVRAFFDSNGDGMGDFRGLAEKLDYLEDLGVNTIWLLPFFPSPWRDDGYDISDFRTVHSAYGNLRDFQVFLKEAHRRGLRVLTELVLNHTSDQHTWFQRSRRAPPGSRWRDFYVWSDSPDKYSGTRIIFKDFEASNWTWDPIAKAYFWHRFYSHQPDLNFDNPLVQRAVFRTIDYWTEMGVDGFRLDAIPYLYEREGTSCENLPETHQFLRELRRHMDEHYPNRLFLAEANMWPEDAIAYFAQGNECHMAFHFPVMPRLFMALRLEDRFPIIEILRRTPPIPENCQWAMFLRNHDELTLEMVTDEERDYMYRVYAADQRSRINLGIRRRLAPLLDNDRPRIELMNAMLFSLPGTPVIYYGDEIGMGDNIYLGDRNGMRTPMQWSPDRNAGFSLANPQQLYLPVNIDPAYHYETINVEAQQTNRHSLLSWTKRLVALRKQYKAFGRGTLDFLQTSNHKVLAFVRRYQDESILIVANLSRFAQPTSLSLAEFRDLTPVEMLGRTEFPPISDAPYSLTLGPNSFFWFALERRGTREEIVIRPKVSEAEAELPLVSVSALELLWSNENRDTIARAMASFVRGQSWYLGEDRRIRSTVITEAIPLSGLKYYLAFLQISFTDGEPQTYCLPLYTRPERTSCAIAKVNVGSESLYLSDAAADPGCASLLLEIVNRRRRIQAGEGVLIGQHNRVFRSRIGRRSGSLQPVPHPGGESSTTIRFDNEFVFKLFRSVEPGDHPEITLGRLLTEARPFKYVAPFVGSIDYEAGSSKTTVGVIHGYLENNGDAWSLTLERLKAYFDQIKQDPGVAENPELLYAENVFSIDNALSASNTDLLGDYAGVLKLLATRLAEMHQVLARDSSDVNVAPERYNDFYRQSLYHSMIRLQSMRTEFLRQHSSELPDEVRNLLTSVLEREDEITQKFRSIYELRIEAVRIRYHSHLGLEHILHSDSEFCFIDFGGDPILNLSQRAIKRTPLRDLASLVHSLAHAMATQVLIENTGARHSVFTLGQLREFGLKWYIQAVAALLRGYWNTPGNEIFMPPTRAQQQALFNVHILERAYIDLRWLFFRRRELFPVPLRIMLNLLGRRQETTA
jgi:maltose alpha-D-glucosyltransferase/alpha-amylase